MGLLVCTGGGEGGEWQQGKEGNGNECIERKGGGKEKQTPDQW